MHCSVCMFACLYPHMHHLCPHRHINTHIAAGEVCAHVSHITQETRGAISEPPCCYLFPNVNVCVRAHALLFTHIFIHTIPTEQMPRAQRPQAHAEQAGMQQSRDAATRAEPSPEHSAHPSDSSTGTAVLSWAGMLPCSLQTPASAFPLQPSDTHRPFPSQLLSKNTHTQS